MSAAYATACEFAAHGLPVFPVSQHKVPLVGKGGFHQASTDPAQLLAWHNRFPTRTTGWAVACGDDLAVVDVDVKHGADVQEAVSLVAGPMVMTGSYNGERGLQVYCRGPAPTADTPLKGVEVRGRGAYVVLPGSPHLSGVTYEWVGDRRPWNADDMGELPAALRPVQRERTTSAATDGRIAEGRRHIELLSLAGTMRRAGMTDREIAAALLQINTDRCDPPFSRAQVLELAHDVATRYDPADPVAPGWLTGVPMDPAAVAPDPPPPLPGFPYMHRGTAAVISGPTGGGRSSLAQAGAYEAALEGLHVAYLGGEVTESEFNDRAALLARLREDDVTDWLRGELARARWLDLGDVMAAAWKQPGPWVAEVSAVYDVVIVDPLGDVMAALNLEDKADHYVRFYKRLVEPLRTAGVAVVILDNIGHAEDAQHRPSGTSSKMNKADLLFSCTARDEPPALLITCTKVRATRARVRKGDTWLFTESTQEIEAQGRQALLTPPKRDWREERQREARLAVLEALTAEPRSERDVVRVSGVARTTAQRALDWLAHRDGAVKTGAGWTVGGRGGPLAQSLKGWASGPPPAEDPERLFDGDVCDRCRGPLTDVDGRPVCFTPECAADRL